MSPSPPLKHADAKALRKAALHYPQTVEDFPWGHSAMKVAGKKTFLFLSGDEAGGFSCSVKLPFRADEALKIKNAKPTEYGLGRAGWVTLTFTAKAKAPLAKLEDWLDESWRAVAPKKLSAAFPPPPARK